MLGMLSVYGLVMIHSCTAHPEGVFSETVFASATTTFRLIPTFLLNHNTAADTAVIHQLSRKNCETVGRRSEVKQDGGGDMHCMTIALCYLLYVRVSKDGAVQPHVS